MTESTKLKGSVTNQDHIEGSADAPITLLEYGDFECPYCGLAYPIVKRLQKDFHGQLRFVFRNFPLSTIHPSAELAAEAAEAASAQGKFWPMHDWLYENQEDLNLEAILTAAKSMKLDVQKFTADLESHKYQEKVKADFNGGVRSGVNGTPTFFINGVRHNEDYEYETLADVITEILDKQK